MVVWYYRLRNCKFFEAGRGYGMALCCFLGADFHPQTENSIIFNIQIPTTDLTR